MYFGYLPIPPPNPSPTPHPCPRTRTHPHRHHHPHTHPRTRTHPDFHLKPDPNSPALAPYFFFSAGFLLPVGVLSCVHAPQDIQAARKDLRSRGFKFS